MKNAKDTAHEIVYGFPVVRHEQGQEEYIAALIRARDKEIIEACKKAVDEEVNLSREGYKSMVKACDSVLCDLG
jgi:hypothetical protein